MSEKQSSAVHSKERLSIRRRRSRRRIGIALSVLAVLFVGASIYGMWQPSVRISHVIMYGTDQSLASIAEESIQGMYFGIIPRDSTFFFSESSIRSSLLSADATIAAVSIFRKGFNGLSLKIDYRVPVAEWCGLARTSDVEEYCYVFDANGFIFSARTKSDEPINAFALYAPLADTVMEPLRATIAQAEKLPPVFDFARQLNQLDAQTSFITIRTDEVDCVLKNGTRITYLLAHEQEAFTALISARSNFNLADGSIEYIDLRFPGKVYVKKNEQLK